MVFNCLYPVIRPQGSDGFLLIVRPKVPGRITNKATASSDTPEKDLSDNSGYAQIYIDYIGEDLKHQLTDQQTWIISKQLLNCLTQADFEVVYTDILVGKTINVVAENPETGKESWIVKNKYLPRSLVGRTELDTLCYKIFFEFDLDSLGVKVGEDVDSIILNMVISDNLVTEQPTTFQRRIKVDMGKVFLNYGRGLNTQLPKDFKRPGDGEIQDRSKRNLFDIDSLFILDVPQIDLDSSVFGFSTSSSYAGDYDAAPISAFAAAYHWLENRYDEIPESGTVRSKDGYN